MIADEFDFYGDVLQYGNRQDREVDPTDEYPDPYYSWISDRPEYSQDEGVFVSIVRVYSADDDSERIFRVTWQEAHE